MNKAYADFGLPHNHIQLIKSVFERYPEIQRVVIYGSRAKGNYRPGSDIDLTIFAPQMSTSDLLKIEGELDDLLLPYKVDLSLYHQIDNSDLLDHIQRVGTDFLK